MEQEGKGSSTRHVMAQAAHYIDALEGQIEEGIKQLKQLSVDEMGTGAVPRRKTIASIIRVLEETDGL